MAFKLSTIIVGVTVDVEVAGGVGVSVGFAVKDAEIGDDVGLFAVAAVTIVAFKVLLTFVVGAADMQDVNTKSANTPTTHSSSFLYLE